MHLETLMCKDGYGPKAIANGGPKRQSNSVLVSANLKDDAIRSEKPNTNAIRLGDSVPISKIVLSYPNALRLGIFFKVT